MDVHIGELASTVRAVDGESILTPRLLERIVDATVARLEERRRAGRDADADRATRTGLATPPWLDDDPGSRG
ncbi:hypothetical protein [Paractinoplanes globisporus]|uniref:Uncharacterized protein n=1 Tax=Paractinoplanes globisporus TaxID=113565 RepID=A0ABW6W9K0_9ACTN|nr:hypothetical protein [Actinoplanes globisporus]